MVKMPEPVTAVLRDVAEPTGQGSKPSQDKECVLAGRSTLNHLELTPMDSEAVAAEIILDVDGTNAG